MENRRFLARATNSGMTAIITPRGEVLDKLDPFKESFLFQNIKLDVANSYYTQHGDTWVFTIVILSGLLFVYTIFKRLSGPVKIEF
ncbi:MAG: hypothetical protein ACD_62C00149G0001 [uncultured bacterium]|nr:MAG: hypothetical protein ACD_62C00149G0001 [uncultured bacterium]